MGGGWVPHLRWFSTNHALSGDLGRGRLNILADPVHHRGFVAGWKKSRHCF
jgi:hypothetical protein